MFLSWEGLIFIFMQRIFQELHAAYLYCDSVELEVGFKSVDIFLVTLWIKILSLLLDSIIILGLQL